MKKPEVITISQQKADSLIESIGGSNLAEENKTLLINMCYFFFWLQDQLQHAQLNINNLKQLIFGSSNEKLPSFEESALEEELDEFEKSITPSDSDSAEVSNDSDSTSEKKKKGRLALEDYPGAEVLYHASSIQSGDRCPEEEGSGRLYPVRF